MTQAFVPGLQIRKNVNLKRWRELPVEGEILVEKGAHVTPDEIVAQASLAGILYVFRVAEQLGIENFEVVKGLKVKEGDDVQVDQIICEHRGLFGLFNSIYKAPQSGQVEFISKRTGHVGVRAAPRKLEVAAHIAGDVVEIIPGKGVLVETNAAFVQGIFGIGGEKRGKLCLLDVPLDHKLLSQDIPSECCDTVLIGGTQPSIGAIELAVERGVKGMIVGSIDDQTLKAYLGYDLGIALTGDEQIPMTLIVTEGFGFIPLAQRVLDVCQNFVGATASINGATQVRAGAMRPEMIIESNQNEAAVEGVVEQQGLVCGARVRLIRVPYFGCMAIVAELPTQMEKLATGAMARVVKVQLEDGSLVTVPRANVELT